MGEYTIELAQPSDTIEKKLVDRLRAAGLNVTVSFDLQSARTNHPQCACPYHGMEACTCQYEVLLVSDQGNFPGETFTITLHGRDDYTWMRLVAPQAPHPTLSAERLGRKLRRLLVNILSIEKV